MTVEQPGEVILVTGANGFLGQFIVQLLHERDERTTEIRTFDISGYTKRLDFKERVPVKTITGDVRHLTSLVEAFQGVDCVIHAAALRDVSAEPDTKAMRQTNVEGTKNVVEACIQAGVSRLVFTSTVELVMGDRELPHTRENQVPIPKRFIFGDFCATKHEAETIVIEADRKPLANGSGTLRTLVLRPVTTYGEGDSSFVSTLLRNTWRRGGTLLRVTRGVVGILQPAYVGNVAWAHVVAKETLARVPDHVAGLPYFITDDTLPCNLYDFVEPFLESRGLHVSPNGIPYWFMLLLLTFANFVLGLISVVHKPPVKLPPVSHIKYACKTFVVNRMRATYRLHYSPIYQPAEAMTRSLDYYRNVPL